MVSGLQFRPGSPAIDSGLDPDETWDPFDDPATPNSGGGANPRYDRGAYEFGLTINQQSPTP
jgi:hypothetical protein